MNAPLMLAQIPDSTFLPAALVALATIAVLFAATALPWWLRRRRRVDVPAESTNTVNVAALPVQGPPVDGPTLRIYNVPVRLAMVILAPVGRSAAPPTAGQIAEILDQVVPGLASVAEAHAPGIQVWPSQLSTQGFLHQFSVNVGLPGDAGKGTPWCSVCGRFESQGLPYLAGLLLCASKHNNLGALLVEREAQWPDMLRVSTSEN